MAPRYDITTLIETIKDLYSRIATLELAKRMRAYRHGGGAESGHDIAAALAEDIDKLAAASDMGVDPALKDTSSKTDTANAERASHNRPPVVGHPSRVNRRFLELTRFFKGKNTASTLQPFMAEKLKGSVWEHINASLRLARSGDAVGAKLHTDVANNALREAARYMSEKEFAEFNAQVKARLLEIRTNTTTMGVSRHKTLV